MSAEEAGWRPRPRGRRRGQAGVGEADPPSRQAQDLIHALTTSVGTSLDAATTLRLKQLVRSSDDAAQAVFEAVLARLRTPHSHVRLLCLLAIDVLVMRSRAFRRLALCSLPTLLPSLLGSGFNAPLPPPTRAAAALKETALECLQRWVISFGAHHQYAQLVLAKRYVQTTLRLRLPCLRERASARERQELARRETTQRLLAERFDTLREELPRGRQEMQGALGEVSRLLAIIQDHKAAKGEHTIGSGCHGDAAEEAGEAESGGGWSQRRVAALQAVTEQQRQAELEATQAALPSVYQALRDMLSDVERRLLPQATQWITTLSRFDAVERGALAERDALLRDAIDVRGALKDAQERCLSEGVLEVGPTEDLQGATPQGEQGQHSESDADDAVEWETDIAEPSAAGVVPDTSAPEAPLEPAREALTGMGQSEAGIPRDPTVRRQPPHRSTGSCSTQQGDQEGRAGRATTGATMQPRGDNPGSSTGGGAAEDRGRGGKRGELRSVAPVLSWGPHLEYWGAETVPAHHMAVSCENHWGAVDDSACLPRERVQELMLMCTTYKAPPSTGNKTATPAAPAPPPGLAGGPSGKPPRGVGTRETRGGEDPGRLCPGHARPGGTREKHQALPAELDWGSPPSPDAPCKGEGRCTDATEEAQGPGALHPPSQVAESSRGSSPCGPREKAKWESEGGFLTPETPVEPAEELVRSVAKQAVHNVRRLATDNRWRHPAQRASGSATLDCGASAGTRSGPKKPRAQGATREHNDRVLHLAAMLDSAERARDQGTPAPGASPVAQRQQGLSSDAAALRGMLKRPASARQRLQDRAHKLMRKAQ